MYKGGFKCISYQKLLSLEMTLMLKSFQSRSEESYTKNRGERDDSLRAFLTRVLESFR